MASGGDRSPGGGLTSLGDAHPTGSPSTTTSGFIGRRPTGPRRLPGPRSGPGHHDDFGLQMRLMFDRSGTEVAPNMDPIGSPGLDRAILSDGADRWLVDLRRKSTRISAGFSAEAARLEARLVAACISPCAEPGQPAEAKHQGKLSSIILPREGLPTLRPMLLRWARTEACNAARRP